MSEHGVARWNRWAEGSWTSVVAPHGVLLLPPGLSEEVVTGLWEEMRSSRASLTAVLDQLVVGAGGRLADIPDFALVVAVPDGVHVAARGEVGLEIDGESVDARRVATWREIFLSGSPTIILRAPERTGSVLRPAADAVLAASAVFVGDTMTDAAPAQHEELPAPEEPGPSSYTSSFTAAPGPVDDAPGGGDASYAPVPSAAPVASASAPAAAPAPVDEATGAAPLGWQREAAPGGLASAASQSFAPAAGRTLLAEREAPAVSASDASEVVEMTEADEQLVSEAPDIDVDDVPVDGSEVVEMTDAEWSEPVDSDSVPLEPGRSAEPAQSAEPVGSAQSAEPAISSDDPAEADEAREADGPVAQDDPASVPGVSVQDEMASDDRPGLGSALDDEAEMAALTGSGRPLPGDHDGWTRAALPENLVDDLGPLVTPGSVPFSSVSAPSAPGSTTSAQEQESSTDTPLSIAVVVEEPEEPVSGRQALSVLCPEGHANPTNYVRCRTCGAELSQPARMITCPPLGRLRIPSGQAIPLDRPVLVGRRPTPEDVAQLKDEEPTLVTLPSPERLVSRNHVLIELDEWSVLARNLSAGNGTMLMRDGAAPQKLPSADSVVLRTGDILDLGDDQSLVLEDLP